MAKRPSLQFYPGDWLRDPGVRSLSLSARGLWIDMLCLMFQDDRPGYLHLNGQPPTHEEIARMTGCPSADVPRLVQELLRSGVASSTDSGVIFNRRMIRDEHARRMHRDRQNGYRKRSAEESVSFLNVTNTSCDARVTHKCEEEEEVDNTPIMHSQIGGECRGEGKIPRASPPPSNLLCHNPELVTTARAVVDHYQRTVRSGYAKKPDAVENVIGCLRRGLDQQGLCAAADRYGAQCVRQALKPQRRQAAATFFAEYGAYEEFLEDRAPETEPDLDQFAAVVAANREKRAKAKKAVEKPQ